MKAAHEPLWQSTQPAQSQQPQWVLPSRERLGAALAYMEKQRPALQHLTFTLKLRTRSRRKEQQLFQAQMIATNMTATILKALQEDRNRTRYDGAIAIVHESVVQTAKTRKRQPSALTSQVRLTKYLADILSKRFSSHLSPKAYPVSGSIRAGVFRQCALMLWNWYRQIVDGCANTEEGIEHVYQRWAEQWTTYEAAAATQMPFGRHRGKALIDVGKREVRWLQKHLMLPEQITQVLTYIDILHNREQYTSQAVQEALAAPHPWRRGAPKQRAVRASRLTQYTVEQHGSRVLLGSLSHYELHTLYEELLEMQEFAAAFANVRQAIDIFLYKAPPTYPTIDSVDVTPATLTERQRAYEACLSWFCTPVSHGTYEENDLPEQLEACETAARTRLLQAEQALASPRLQPLIFPRTMRPKPCGNNQGVSKDNLSSFALLYDRETYEYVLAVAIQGKYAQDRVAPHVGSNLYYVNFPEVQFQLPRGSAIMLFPLECGREYQDRILREIITQQQNAQRQIHNEHERTTALGYAKITSKENAAGYREYYLYLSVPMPVPQGIDTPTTIIGVHEHRLGYSYALLGLDGDVMHVGELTIPQHVVPHEDDAYYNCNYTFEVANAIVRLAHMQNAYLAIEDTSWRKKQPELSRTKNRPIFARPSKKVAEAVTYKALLAGLLPVHMTLGVAPSRDCGHCGYRSPSNKRALRNVLSVECPNCCVQQTVQESDVVMYECRACTHVWQAQESIVGQEFYCTECRQTNLAHYNAAIVVARRALEQLVERYEATVKR